MEEYYDSNRVSNSHLSWFQISPKYYKLRIDKQIEEEPKTYFENGKVLHMYILEPNEFKEKYTFFDFQQPSTKQQEAFCKQFIKLKEESLDNTDNLVEAYKFAYSTKGKSENKISKEAKKLIAQLGHYISYLETTSSGRIVLPNSRQKYLEEAENNLKSHVLANVLLWPGDSVLLDPEIEIHNEFRIDWIDPITKLECKSLIDRLVINHSSKTITLIDLKTTSDMSNFNTKIYDYKYNRQLAYYWSAIHYYLKEQGINWEELEHYKRLTYIIAISSVDPIEVRVYPIGEQSLLKGLEEYQELLQDLHWHINEDKWEHTKAYYTRNGLEYEL